MSHLLSPAVQPLRSLGVLGAGLATVSLVACSDPESGDGPQSSAGAAGSSSAIAGQTSSGRSGTAGSPALGLGGASTGVAGAPALGGTGPGPTGGTGGSVTFGGSPAAMAGSGAGGSTGVGGSGAGGRAGAAGSGGRGGAPAGSGGSGSGGNSGSGSAGAATAGAAGASGTQDPCTVTTLPSGGTDHASSNAQGKAGGLNWTIWSNGTGGSITTYDVPAFKATWDDSGDFLARLGLQWDATKTYDQFGTITAQFSSKKTGTGGQFSYVGIYGWSVSPCIEWYIIDDSYNRMPVNPGNTTNKGTADIDGGKYTLYTRSTSGTGGSKCQGVSNWEQFYSVRQTARQCGQISITQHFEAWKAAGMMLGKMDQAQILIEVGGGTGSIEFPVANVTVSP